LWRLEQVAKIEAIVTGVDQAAAHKGSSRSKLPASVDTGRGS
jgi:hypothetical protein